MPQPNIRPLGLKTIPAAAPGHVTSVRNNLIDLLSEEELQILTNISQRVVTTLEPKG